MKIYSDVLTRVNIQASAPKGTYVYQCDVIYSENDSKITSRRKRKRCYDVLLSGSNSHAIWGRRGVKAATYDEWGYFLADVFDQDKDAICGPYDGLADFESKTKCKFLSSDERKFQEKMVSSGMEGVL